MESDLLLSSRQIWPLVFFLCLSLTLRRCSRNLCSDSDSHGTVDILPNPVLSHASDLTILVFHFLPLIFTSITLGLHHVASRFMAVWQEADTVGGLHGRNKRL
jgi:hypothetical protein